MIDKASADEADFVAGDRITVLTQAGPIKVVVSGIARFGTVDSPGGASFVLFTDEAAQRLVGEADRYDAIAVVADDGVSQTELVGRIESALDDDVEVLTGEEITEENQSDIKENLSFFNTFLLTFALIALFVGSFIIYNTFSIIVAQQTREMALLRAIGASRRQVLTSVLLESLAVGLFASVVGLFAGIGVAAGLKALLALLGIDIPAGGIVLAPSTVVWSLVAGVVVSMAAAFFPARRASKVPPVAAMRDVAIDTSSHSRRRVIAGAVVTIIGVAALLNGLFGSGGVSSVGLGAAVIFVGVAVLGPVIATPMSRIIGSPLPRIKGIAGTLARENAMRNPKRTSATAAALMIGVGLVGFITIVASSAKASIEDVIGEAFQGDVVVDSGTFGFGGLPPEMADRLNELPEVEGASGIRFSAVEVDGKSKGLLGIDPRYAADIVDFGIEAGSVSDLDETGVSVLDTVAEDRNLSIGDPVEMRFAETGVQELVVRSIHSQEELGGEYFVGFPVFEANVPDQFDFQVWIALADDVSFDDGRAAVERVADDYPQAEVLDEQEYIDTQGAFVDQLLNLIYVMLALAILIALMGIANTLALSIFERTRELGLLRAVGMTRRQLKSTVRWEAVIIALLGAVLGLVIGVFFGWALFQALKDEGFTTFRIPVGQLAVIAALAALAGVVAAILPARRAARLDVLKAVSH